ncbi:MAG: AAA family ATPase [Flavobacteriaceae bacterium]|nr:AAA family ATPase [Flavobacteriaceae bacterium]
MEDLFEKYRQKVNYTSTTFVRSIMNDINWNSRLIGIKGVRGIGKTTLLLQYIKLNLSHELENTLYVSLDNIWFSNHSLIELVDYFVKRGGKYLFLDEVHKYPNWSQELKNIYDDFPLLKVVFTGSSLLEILNARADLSRRARIYLMQGLSFREYINMETGIEFERFTLNEILENQTQIANNIITKIKPLHYFDSYLKLGYYPFYKENPELYHSALKDVINMVLEIELPLLRGVDLSYVFKIKQLLVIIAESVPFVPNVSKLSEKMGINRSTLLLYIHYLDEIELTANLYKQSGGISKLQKPVKIFLDNTNLMFALTPKQTNLGNIRETFFANQLSYQHQLMYVEHGDFLVDEHFVFEIGGKNKNTKQLKNTDNAFVAADNLEIGFNKTIPLWLFGFLY